MKRKLIAVILWVAIWECLSLAVKNPLLLAGPWDTLQALGRLAVTADFWLSMLNTSLHILCGFAVGSLLGIITSAAAYRYRWFSDFFGVFMQAIKSVPVVSFVLILLIWTGSRMLSFWIPLLVVWPVFYLNTKKGLDASDRGMLEMADVFGMHLSAKIRTIYLPQLKPYFLSAFSLALGMCWKSGVAAEVIGQPLGTIGNGLYRSKINLDTARLFAWTLVIVLLSVLFERIADWILSRLLVHKPTK